MGEIKSQMLIDNARICWHLAYRLSKVYLYSCTWNSKVVVVGEMKSILFVY